MVRQLKLFTLVPKVPTCKQRVTSSKHGQLLLPIPSPPSASILPFFLLGSWLPIVSIPTCDLQLCLRHFLKAIILIWPHLSKLLCTWGTVSYKLLFQEIIEQCQCAAENQSRSPKWQWKWGTLGNPAPSQPQVVQLSSSQTGSTSSDKAAADSIHKWDLF